MTTQQQIEKLEELRADLLLLIESSIDSLLKQSEQSDNIELELPLSSNSKVFKGRKPVAVVIDTLEYPTPTWVKVTQVILKEVVKEEERCRMLQGIANKVIGNKRVILAFNPDVLNRPIIIMENLFMEGYYDTETMLNVLKEHILQAINYDYSSIKIKYKL